MIIDSVASSCTAYCVAAVSGSLPVGDSGKCSVQCGDGCLDSGSGVGLVMSSTRQIVYADPQLTSTHSTNAEKFP